MNPYDSLTELELSPLPPQVETLCEELNAPARLIAHLILVHDVAIKLVKEFNKSWPNLTFDKEEVLFGAATHDIGKAVYKEELTGPGHRHESEGWKILKQHSFSSRQARFTQTHAKWQHDQSITIEDLIVALADNCWKGKRNEELELLITKIISKATNQPDWETFIGLDDILQLIFFRKF